MMQVKIHKNRKKNLDYFDGFDNIIQSKILVHFVKGKFSLFPIETIMFDTMKT